MEIQTDAGSDDQRDFFEVLHQGKRVFHIGHYKLQQAKRPLEQHHHGNSIEICFMEKGRQIYRVKDEYFQLRELDFFMTFPFEEHDTGGHPEEKGALYWIIIPLPKNAHSFWGMDRDESGIIREKLLNIQQRLFHGQPESLGILSDFFRLVKGENHEMRELQIKTQFVYFLLHFIQCSQQRNPEERSSHITDCLSFIDENIFDNLTTEALAKRAFLSTSWFKSRFKKEVGQPPADYILRRKVEKAAELLAAGELSVTEVAHRLGFSSSQYFATVFRRYKGQSPSKYVQK